MSLSRERCWHHEERAAACRCRRCQRYYCRECVAEHDGRLLCAGCLRELAGGKGQAAGRRWIGAAVALVMAAAMCWLWFLLAGEALVAARPVVEAGEWRQR